MFKRSQANATTKTTPKGRVRRALPRQNKSSMDSDTEIEDTDQDDQVFEVEAIKGKKLGDDNQIYYLVKWKGYTTDPTWEPETFCKCDKKIQEYESIVGAQFANGNNSNGNRSINKAGNNNNSSQSRASTMVENSRRNSRSKHLKSPSPANSIRITRNRRQPAL